MPPRDPRIARSGSMPRWLSRGHSLRFGRAPFRAWRWALLAVLLLAGAAVIAARLDPLPPRFSGEARASDGDSFRIGRERVRLVGLDAPELDQVCWRTDGTEWPCGREARAEMNRLLAAGNVACDPEGNDRFGRTLARCTIGGKDIGAAMVRQGLAISDGSYGSEEAEARRSGRGLWSGRFVDPREWRDEGPSNDPGPSWIELLWIWFKELTGATAVR